MKKISFNTHTFAFLLAIYPAIGLIREVKLDIIHPLFYVIFPFLFLPLFLSYILNSEKIGIKYLIFESMFLLFMIFMSTDSLYVLFLRPSIDFGMIYMFEWIVDFSGYRGLIFSYIIPNFLSFLTFIISSILLIINTKNIAIESKNVV